MASFMRKLALQLVTHPPPPTPKDMYKLMGVSGPTPKSVAYFTGRPTPRSKVRMLILHRFIKLQCIPKFQIRCQSVTDALRAGVGG